MSKQKRWGIWVLVVLLLAVGMMLPAPAQASAEETPLSLWVNWVDVSGFPEVTVYLSVWGSNGLPVSGLAADNFQIQEDDGSPLRPERVKEDSQAPLQVVLVMDVSGSMAGKPLSDAKAAAARFLDRLSPGDQAALIAFSAPVDPDPARLDAKRELGFTSDLTPLYGAIENLQSGGKTALYNAVQKAVGLAAALPVGHRAVLLLTDGRNDPPDVGDPEAAIALAKRAHVPVFVIGLGKDIDVAYLQRLAGETGGLFRSAPSSAELARLFDDMATLLKTQYVLTYHSGLPADGAQHTLTVTVHSAQGQAASAEGVSFGPLPQAQPTATPQPTPTAAPTLAPTATPLPTHTPTAIVAATPTRLAASPPPSSGNGALPWPWLVALLAGAGAVLGLLALVLRRRRKPPREFCAQCGYDLTGHPGACPVCGSTRRLTKPKR